MQPVSAALLSGIVNPKSGVGNSDYLAFIKKKIENQTTLDFSSTWNFFLFGLYYLCWKWSVFLKLPPWKQFSLCWNNNGIWVIWYSKQLFQQTIFKASSKDSSKEGELHPTCVEDSSWKWVFQAAFCLDQLLLSHNPLHHPSPNTQTSLEIGWCSMLTSESSNCSSLVLRIPT